MLLEVCVDSVESACAAETGGAQRVELCAALCDGGVTPSAGTIEAVRAAVGIAMHVMIRPRAGDFCYSDTEFAVMKRDILYAKAAGADGVVFGLLKDDRTVDLRRSRELAELAAPLAVTFHRAFDITPAPFPALADVLRTGASHLLTSGGQRTAAEGIFMIREMQHRSEGKISIIAGSGIDKNNARKLMMDAGVFELHVLSSVSRIVTYPGSTLFDAQRWVVDAAAVTDMVRAMHGPQHTH